MGDFEYDLVLFVIRCIHGTQSSVEYPVLLARVCHLWVARIVRSYTQLSIERAVGFIKVIARKT